jgi:hypothetical protein
MTAHVHLFWGRMGFIPSVRSGLETLEDLLDAIKQTDDADLHDWKSWRRVAAHVAAARKPGDRIIFIGHSEGAKVAVDAAKFLAERKILVDLIVGIDPTLNTAMPYMPNNVLRVAEYHATHGLVASIRRVFGNGQFKYHPNWPGMKAPVHVEPGSHIGVSKDSDVHKSILAFVRSALV